MFVTEEYVFPEEPMSSNELHDLIIIQCTQKSYRTNECTDVIKRLLILHFLYDVYNKFRDDITADMDMLYIQLTHQITLPYNFICHHPMRSQKRFYESQQYFFEIKEYVRFIRNANKTTFFTRDEETLKSKTFRKYIRFATSYVRKYGLSPAIMYNPDYTLFHQLVYAQYIFSQCNTLDQLNRLTHMPYYQVQRMQRMIRRGYYG